MFPSCASDMFSVCVCVFERLCACKAREVSLLCYSFHKDRLCASSSYLRPVCLTVWLAGFQPVLDTSEREAREEYMMMLVNAKITCNTERRVGRGYVNYSVKFWLWQVHVCLWSERLHSVVMGLWDDGRNHTWQPWIAALTLRPSMKRPMRSWLYAVIQECRNLDISTQKLSCYLTKQYNRVASQGYKLNKNKTMSQISCLLCWSRCSRMMTVQVWLSLDLLKLPSDPCLYTRLSRLITPCTMCLQMDCMSIQTLLQQFKHQIKSSKMLRLNGGFTGIIYSF